MISDETSNLPTFYTHGNIIELTIDNVRLAETVYNIYNRRGNQQLQDLYNTLLNDYSYESIGIDFDNYSDYVLAIKHVIGESNISKNGFDHLVWLYNR